MEECNWVSFDDFCTLLIMSKSLAYSYSYCFCDNIHCGINKEEEGEEEKEEEEGEEEEGEEEEEDRENRSILKYIVSNLIYVPHNESADCFYFVATQNLIKIEIGKTDVI